MIRDILFHSKNLIILVCGFFLKIYLKCPCQVKNKLDDQTYAIKRIRLNPADRQINKKIMREVKLLSRLNHENVVRYYNSWQVSAFTHDYLNYLNNISPFFSFFKLEFLVCK